MGKILLSSYLFLILFILGCTNLFFKKENNFDSSYINSANQGELSKCSFRNGFNDSIKGNRPDDLCFLIKDDHYKNGFRNGNSYQSKLDVKNSLSHMIDEKIKVRNSIMNSGLKYGMNSDFFNENSLQISEMKKELSSLERELIDLKNENTTSLR